MNFKKTYKKASGYTPLCKIGECSLKKLEFGIIELEDGESVAYDTENKETAFIILEGYCTVKFNDVVWKKIGNRNTVFENKKAVSFYMPIEQKLTVEANGHVKIAVCGAVVTEKTEPQLLPEEHVILKTLGEVPYERETSFIVDGNSSKIKCHSCMQYRMWNSHLYCFSKETSCFIRSILIIWRLTD